MDDQHFDDFLNGVRIQAQTATDQDRRFKARKLLLQSAAYAEYARAALIGEHGVMPRASYFWEVALGMSPAYYAVRARRLAQAATYIIETIEES